MPIRKKVTNDAPRMLSLCSGIGGIDLAAEWAGWQVAGQCEIDPWCRGILARHWPDVKCMPDIRDVWGDSFDGGPIDLIAGGIPCQPFSVAGHRRGELDPRHLWPEMRRIAQVFEPTWLLIENVAGFVNLALDDVLTDMEALGYEAGALVLPAAAVGAPHRRDRVFVLAHASRQRWLNGSDHRQGRHLPTDRERDAAQGEPQRNGRQRGTGALGATLANANRERASAPHDETSAIHPGGQTWADTRRRRGRETQPRMVRGADGLPTGVDRHAGYTHRWPAGPQDEQYEWEPPRGVEQERDNDEARLHALGNAVVPQQIYPILRVMYLTHMTERAAQEMSL